MRQKSKRKFIFFLLQFLFIGGIQCPKLTIGCKKVAAENIVAFGIKQSDIPQQYANIFIEKKSENIRWQIGAFLVDRMLREFEQKYFVPIEAVSSSASANSAVSRIKKGKMNEKTKIKGKEKKEIMNVEIEKKIGKIMKNAGAAKMKEFERKLGEYTKKKLELEKMKKEFGAEEMSMLFGDLFLDELFEEYILAKFGEKIRHGWNLKKEIDKCIGKEKNEKVARNIVVLICILHRDELGTLLVGEGVQKENKLYKGIQQMNVESNKKMGEEEEAEMEWIRWKNFGYMKEIMRRMAGSEWVYEGLENVAPILMRMDIIEPKELLKIFSKVLSVPNESKDEEAHEKIKRLTKLTIFGKIWNLRKQKTRVRDRLARLWEEKKMVGGPSDNDLFMLWMKIMGIEDPGVGGQKEAEYLEKVKEFRGELREKGKEQIVELFEEIGEFKEFLDKTEGSRGRIVGMFSLEWEIGDIFIEGREMAKMLKIEPNEEEIEEIFYENYLRIFSTKNEMLRKKAAMRIFILIGVEYLDGQFEGELGEESEIGRPQGKGQGQEKLNDDGLEKEMDSSWLD